MWKCASRTIKATFHKGILKCSNALSTKAPVDKDVCPLSKLAPAFVEHLSRYYGSCKNSCSNYSKYKRGKGGFRRRNSFLGGFENNVFDALRMSGVIVLAYYYLVPFSRKNFPQIPGPTVDCPSPTVVAYHKSLEYLINKFGAKSVNYVLPEVKAARDRVVETTICTDSVLETIKSDKDNFNCIEKAHLRVLGSLNNWKGTDCMESGRYSEGVQHFIRAAQQQNVSAIFNLGICHERGLGTSRNIKRAAELYRKAANLGHPTAMYNLGVLYTKGSGGIKVDIDRARQLFQAAARLGQRDALKALKLEKEALGQLPEEIIVAKETMEEKKENKSIIESICDELLNQPAEDCKVCLVGVKTESCDPFAAKKEMNSTLDNDSGVLDLSPHNESDVVLV